MVQRRKIALIYRYDENWIGGTYYIENLINALGTLPASEQPELTVLTERPEDFLKVRHATTYCWLKSKPYVFKPGVTALWVNRFTRSLLGKNIFPGAHHDIDVLFPAVLDRTIVPDASYIYWIPDFQEHFLPEFFEQTELENRRSYQAAVVSRGKYIVFSSHSARMHFEELFPESGMKHHVLPFAVSHNAAPTAADALRVKFKLPEDYYVCCNQFWQHKNHKLVVDMLALRLAEGEPVSVVFTGKEHDYRAPEYFQDLKNLIKLKGIEDRCLFLGFIDRRDQLAVMQGAIAVIQPSLFEGWSTVVEDAKSLGLPVLASNIGVHQEQLQNYPNARLFDPASPTDLSKSMQSLADAPRVAFSYVPLVENFGRTFLSVVDEVLKQAGT